MTTARAQAFVTLGEVAAELREIHDPRGRLLSERVRQAVEVIAATSSVDELTDDVRAAWLTLRNWREQEVAHKHVTDGLPWREADERTPDPGAVLKEALRRALEGSCR